MFVVVGAGLGAAAAGAGLLGAGTTLATGALIGGGIGAVGGSLLSGSQQADAAKDAAALQAQAADRAAQLQWEQYQQTRADQMPWLKAGERALGTLEEQVAAGPGQFSPEGQPGYQFGFKEFVEKPYLSAQSAKGKRLSGETYKGLTRYAQDYANTAYDNFLQRYYARLAPVQSLAGVGQTTATNLGAAGQNYANAASEIAGAKGQAQAEGILNAANARAQSYQSIFNTAGAIGNIGAYSGWFK